MLYHCPFCSVYIFVSYDAAKAFNEMPALQRAEFLNKAGGHQKQYEDPITHKIFEYPTQETRIYGITHWIPEEWKESK